MSDDALAAEDDLPALRRKLRGAQRRIETLTRDLENMTAAREALRSAYMAVMQSMRDDIGTCRACNTPLGEPHRQSCAAWLAIGARFL